MIIISETVYIKLQLNCICIYFNNLASNMLISLYLEAL